MKLVDNIVVIHVIIMEFLDVSPGNLITVTYFTREWNTVQCTVSVSIFDVKCQNWFWFGRYCFSVY